MAGESTRVQQDFLDIVTDDFEISRGKPLPLGSTIEPGGINFAVFTKHAQSVSLVLFDPATRCSVAEFPLDPRFNRTGDIWHSFVRGVSSNIEYGYRVVGREDQLPHIHRFGPSKVLLDPYAKALAGGEIWGKGDSRSDFPDSDKSWRSLIMEDNFDWGFDQPLNIPLSETIIYELHVRGFTQHETSNVNSPGTYAGLIEKIPYLKEIGITAVELLPINEFSEIDSDRINPETGQRLLNYWGYHSIGFFAPKAGFSSDKTAGAQVREFKYLVKTLHEAGIEVILDVVFNHTAEGNELGPTLSFRGLDNSIYYLINPDSGEYHNYTGCGNTLNCNHPVVRDMILDCLRYWVMEMHVDGFRFDLASVLGRGRDGSVLANPPLLERIAADPILGCTKLIAEAWDAAGLYQVGTFPSWGRWAEWNGKFRDDIRKFIKSDPGMVPTLAGRLLGSPDIYEGSGRNPHHSVNFITCHDGFTLRDLVSYNEKHNNANGEDGRDGANDNHSWNCGCEGAANKPETLRARYSCSLNEIESLRYRQTRNFATLLLLSRGVPMILAGDEIGRSQGGNNNAYCQDNDISWINWDLARENSDLFRFFRLLIEFRKQHPGLRYNSISVAGKELVYPVAWHGVQPDQPDWSFDSRCLAMQITEQENMTADYGVDIYLAANAYWETIRFTLPKLSNKRKWYRKVDTSLGCPRDITETLKEPKLGLQESYEVNPRTVVVLVGK